MKVRFGHVNIAANLEAVRARMANALLKSGRPAGSVQLVAVSKFQSVESIKQAYVAGQRLFGENRAQELVEKVPALPSDIRWHFIGELQRNKVKQVRPLVSIIESLDRDRLIDAWGGDSAPPGLLQVRLGGETSKAGFDPDQVMGAVARASSVDIEIAGLMSIPPPASDPEDARPWFQKLAELSATLTNQLPSATVISMGMSHDFETAIEEGATTIRVGSAIFGPR